MASNDPGNPAALGRRGLFAAGAAFSAAAGGSVDAQKPPPPIDTGVVRDGRVSFPDWRGEAEPPSPPAPMPTPPEQRVEVFARIRTPANDPRSAEVEDTVSLVLRSPSGTIANRATSYSAFNSKDLRVQFERGWAHPEDRRPRTPGEEGLRDRLAMEAIYRSAATGQPVAMERVEGLGASRGPEAEWAS